MIQETSTSSTDLRDKVGAVVRFFLCMVLSLPVLIFWLPNVEQPRGEARQVQAWIRARTIAAEWSLQHTNGTADEIPEPDPWGNKYKVHVAPTGTCTVISSGANGQFEAPGAAVSDDISSGMITSPAKAHSDGRRRELALAVVSMLTVAGVLFGVSLRVYR